ncbi:MAG: hypothetical protein HY649_03815 [Acidobacteria bacterium]|nr:hypothetical protein [Acidobacteriota bacterium]
MRTSRKDRRSERIEATHRLLLSILGPSGAEVLKEIVTTVEVSQHGARIHGLRTFQTNWRGNLLQLSSGRQVPFRVVWQVKPPSGKGYLEAGVEILAEFNFWGRAFANPDAEPETTAITIENPALSPEELLQALRQSSAFQSPAGERLLETIWCGLVQQLEERNVFTRAELVAALRKISQM